MNLSLAGLSKAETGGRLAALNTSHQGAAWHRLSSNIDSAAESHVGQREQGARLIYRTPIFGGVKGREGRKEGK